MFGDEAAARKRRGENRSVGRKAHIGVKRHDEAQAGAGAVDRRDNGLWHGWEIGIRRLEIGVRVRVEGLFGGRVALPAVVLDALQRSHVGARAKSATGAREYDDAHGIVVGRRAHGGADFVTHPRCPGVQSVGRLSVTVATPSSTS